MADVNNIDKDVLILIKKLTQLSLQKKDFMERYYLLTNDQKRYLDEEDVDSFQSVFEEKEDIASKISAIDEAYLKLFTELKRKLNVSSLDEVKPPLSSYFKKMQETVAVIMELTENCILIDNENIKQANDLLRRYADEIKKNKNRKTVIKEYQKPEIKDNIKPISKKF